MVVQDAPRRQAGMERHRKWMKSQLAVFNYPNKVDPKKGKKTTWRQASVSVLNGKIHVSAS